MRNQTLQPHHHEMTRQARRGHPEDKGGSRFLSRERRPIGLNKRKSRKKVKKKKKVFSNPEDLLLTQLSRSIKHTNPSKGDTVI